MTIRGRLLTAFAAMVLALVGLGAWSAWRLFDLGRVAERILADNYLSIEAAQTMRVSLERLAARSEMARGDVGSELQAAADRQAFDAAFSTAAHNITEAGEAEIVAALRTGYDQLQSAPVPASASEVRRSLAALEAVNVSAMRAKSDAAGALARRDGGWALALMAVLTLGGAWLTLAVARGVIGPMETLTLATTRLAAGDLDVAVPAGRNDELGQMARAFNEMAARVRQARASDRDALAEARQVTERMMLLEDVRHLHELNRLKSEFVAEASHELRTPLTSLQLGLNLLAEQSQTLTPRQREIVDLCREDGERLARLARDLLDLSRIESGQRSPRRERVNVGTLLRETVAPLLRQSDARGVRFEVDVPEGVPEVDADRAQIERVLTNLLSNALRATPHGGRITASARAEPERVVIAVADTGIGIPPEYLPRLFEPFVQVPGGSRGGAGLGLAISRRIVEAHGGVIGVQSTPGAGTTFTFTLPRAAGEENGHANPDRR